MQRLDVGRGEAQRVDEALRAHAVAATKVERDRALFASFRQRARELGDNEGVEPFGRARQRNRAALGKAQREGVAGVHVACVRSRKPGAARRADAGTAACRIRRASRTSFVIHESISDRHVEPALEFVEFAVAHRGEPGVREMSERYVHLAYSAPPAAEQNAAPARIEAVAEGFQSWRTLV